MKNTTQLSHRTCTGCGVCANRCPKKIISMEEDKEGFFYPIIREPSACVGCGACMSICPAINRTYAKEVDYGTALYASCKDENRLSQSASGGVAGGLYRTFLNEGNSCIVGVRYTEDFRNVEYVVTDEEENISSFLGSKYIKADIHNIYDMLLPYLQSGKKVLVIGLPCEVAAVKSRFIRYQDLYTAELICHGPTTKQVLSSYIDCIERENESRVVNFSLRKKQPTWKPYYIYAEFENGSNCSEKFIESSFSDAFQIIKRKSCNHCPFKDGHSCSDLILGDFHAALKGTMEYNQYGSSIVFPITDKGRWMVSQLDKDFNIGQADKKRAMGNTALIHPIRRYMTREFLLTQIRNEGVKKAVNSLFVRKELAYRRYELRVRNFIRIRVLKK